MLSGRMNDAKTGTCVRHIAPVAAGGGQGGIGVVGTGVDPVTSRFSGALPASSTLVHDRSATEIAGGDSLLGFDVHLHHAQIRLAAVGVDTGCSYGASALGEVAGDPSGPETGRSHAARITRSATAAYKIVWTHRKTSSTVAAFKVALRSLTRACISEWRMAPIARAPIAGRRGDGGWFDLGRGPRAVDLDRAPLLRVGLKGHLSCRRVDVDPVGY